MAIDRTSWVIPGKNVGSVPKPAPRPAPPKPPKR